MKTVDFVIRENLPNVNQDLESVWIAVRTWHVTPWMVPPARLQQNNWSPGPNIAATPGSTLGMVSSESVKADKVGQEAWAVYAIRLNYMLGFPGELNRGT